MRHTEVDGDALVNVVGARVGGVPAAADGEVAGGALDERCYGEGDVVGGFGLGDAVGCEVGGEGPVGGYSLGVGWVGWEVDVFEARGLEGFALRYVSILEGLW